MHALQLTIRRFAIAHDETPVFHAVYLVLTFLAAALLNVGTFGLLVLAHMVLDLVKYREFHAMPWGRTLGATFRESLIDLFLLALALCLAVYLHHGQSIVALSGFLRMEVTIVSAFAVLLPRLEVTWHLLGVFGNIRKHLQHMHGVTGALRMYERLMLAGFFLSVLLVVIAPVVLGDSASVSHVLADELLPWRL